MAQAYSLVVVVATLCVGATGPEAQARQSKRGALAELNGMVTAGPGYKDASAILFPKIAAMAQPPEPGLSEHDASVLTARSPTVKVGRGSWGEWSAWAAEGPQQAALEALKAVTDPKERFTLGLAYGEAGVSPEWVKAGLFVDLGRPPLVARGPRGMRYLEGLGTLAALCTVESARRAEVGEGGASIGALVNWLRLGRMVAEREFYAEKRWGMTQMIAATERMRDIAYLYPDMLKEADAALAVGELDMRSLTPDRIRFPEGEKQGLVELLSLTMEERGGPDGVKFAATMGRLAAEGRGMNAFSQAAHWAELAGSHAGWFDTRDELDKVFGAWHQRWDINNIFDPIMREATDYSKMDRRRFAMIEEVVAGVENIFDLRTRLMVALSGTRTAMGVVGFRARFGRWPPNISAVQPQFVKSLDNDPWGYDQKLESRSVFRYFVPIRDVKVGPRETAGPHTMQVMIVRDESLMRSNGAGGGGGDLLGGVFPPFAVRSFRDALADGIPSRLLDPQSGEVRLEAFRDYLSAELAKLAIEPVTLKQLQDLAKAMDASAATALVALIDPSKLHGPQGQSLSESVEKLLKRISEAMGGQIPENVQGADGKFDVAKFRAGVIDAIKASGLPEEAQAEIIAQFEKLSDQEIRASFEALRSIARGTDGPMLSFTVELTDATFVLYSVGKDGRAGGARTVGNAAGAGDILVFPAPLSLERQRLASEK